MNGAVETAAAVVGAGAKVVSTAASVLSWLPWAIAGCSLLAGAGGTLWYRGEWKDCQASVAIDANQAQERLRAQQHADAEFRRQLSETLAPIVNDLRKQANDTQIALAKVPSHPQCGGTPAARAFDGVVQPAAEPGQARPGAARPARP